MMCVPLARPGLALRRCIMHGNYVRSTIFFHSFTRDSQTTVCLGLLVVCCFSPRGLLMYAPSCTPHPSYTQMINQRLYIYVERRCGQSHRVHTLLAVTVILVCVCCLHDCLVCATNDVRSLAQAAMHAHTLRHGCACTARPHHCRQVLSPGLQPQSCMYGPSSRFLVGRLMCGKATFEGMPLPHIPSCMLLASQCMVQLWA